MVLLRLANTRNYTHVTLFRHLRNFIRRSNHLDPNNTIQYIYNLITNHTRHITNTTNDAKIFNVTRRIRQVNNILFKIRRCPRARNNIRLTPTHLTQGIKRPLMVLQTLLLTLNSIFRRNIRTINAKLSLPIPTRRLTTSLITNYFSLGYRLRYFI